MSNDEDIVDKEVLEEARAMLDVDGTIATPTERVFLCVEVLLRGLLDKALEEYDA